jgi:hypothetical protein
VKRHSSSSGAVFCGACGANPQRALGPTRFLTATPRAASSQVSKDALHPCAHLQLLQLHLPLPLALRPCLLLLCCQKALLFCLLDPRHHHRHAAAQYHRARHSTAQHSTAQHSTAQNAQNDFLSAHSVPPKTLGCQGATAQRHQQAHEHNRPFFCPSPFATASQRSNTATSLKQTARLTPQLFDLASCLVSDFDQS